MHFQDAQVTSPVASDTACRRGESLLQSTERDRLVRCEMLTYGQRQSDNAGQRREGEQPRDLTRGAFRQSNPE